MTLAIASPCTGICKLDDATGWCLGCGRDGQEIADWRTEPDARRAVIWADIPRRLAAMGVGFQRLPMTTEDIRAFVIQALSEGRGTWVTGVVGAVAEFTAAPGQAVEVREEGDDIIAFTRNGATRMHINDDVRALTFDPEGTETPRIVLAVKREKGRLPRAGGVTDLGEDSARLMQGEGRVLYDLGLNRKEGRFCVRVQPGPAKTALDAARGLSFTEALPRIAGPLIGESPVRVVESALGRIEVAGAIPPPTASSPPGPHTHLLPDHLATGRALPAGMDLPRAYLPGAIFYPPRS